MTTKKNIICLSLISITLLTCKKKSSTYVDVDANVYITKTVDSLPCQANIEYSDFTNRSTSQTISGNWTVHHSLHYDQYVILKATGTSNVKTILVEICAKGSTESKSCNGNCTLDVRKDLYN